MRPLSAFAAMIFVGTNAASGADTLAAFLEKTREEHSVPAMAAAVVDSKTFSFVNQLSDLKSLSH